MMNKIISHNRLRVNHNFDTKGKTFYPLVKRLEGRANGRMVRRGKDIYGV
jgi:hypothetical protein